MARDSHLESIANWRVFEKAEEEIRSPGEPDDTWSTRQVQMYYMLEDLARWVGKFDKTGGADGAHYMDTNPFASEGLKCSNCAFYEADGSIGTCEVVEGVINPNAVCKLWIIPEKVIGPEAESAGYTWKKPKKKKPEDS